MACTKQAKINMQDIEDSLENSLTRKLHELPGQPRENNRITIPRIPIDIIESNNNRLYYEPRTVSIGPYYHGKERYRDTEQHKMRYLRDFLSRHQVRLEVLVKEIRALEARARQCYSGFICLNSELFIEMLLLDGCFILEVCSKKLNKENDALVDISWIKNRIVTDFLLIENQIPFFVIHKLYSFSVSYRGLLSEKESGDQILLMLTDFVQWRAPLWVWPRQFETPQCEIHHLLHFYQEFYVPKKTKVQNSSDGTMQSSIARLKSFFCGKADQGSPVYILPSATDLREAGVIFRRKQLPDNILDITFKNGIFEMPMIGTGLEEKISILNLIAWNSKIGLEHQKQSNDSSHLYLYPLTSYIMLLESLLRTKNDIKLLKAQDIIENNDPSDEQLANFFNHLGDLNVICGEFYFADLFSDIKGYYDRRWHRHRAKLKREYFLLV
ncbi:UPF0481 protein At3g47200-like [Carex rostrata]